MKDNQEIVNGATLDMSSNDPHVTVDCPVCGKAFMKKVETGVMLKLPCDHVEYKMKNNADGSVEITGNLITP